MSSTSIQDSTLNRSDKPPGPKGPPIIGIYPYFRKDPAAFLLKLSQEYGDLVYFTLGSQKIYFLNRPEFVQDILVTNQHKFIKSRMLQRSKVLLGEGLLTSEGQFHLRQRRLAQPAFHRERLIGYSRSMSEIAVRHSMRWRAGETRDISRDMMRLTLAVVAQTLFSADVDKDAQSVGEALDHVMSMFDTLLLPWADLLQKLPIPQMQRFEKARDQLDRIIYGLIREHREAGVDRGDLLSMLLLAQDEDDGGVMTDKQVRDEALTLFLAGHETTSNALTWTWYLLSQHPDVEQKLHEELQTVLNGRTPQFEDLPQLRYTEMVFAESMRLYSPAWAIGRMSIEDHEVDGYRIPAQSIVILSPYAMHRNARFWPDPERFNPDRWTAEARDSRPKLAYFPFGAGPRICIGERFAWMEGMLVLATYAQNWRLRLEPGHKVQTLPQLTLRTRYGMRMRIETR